VPGAINLPALSNEERAGWDNLRTEAPFKARKIGAALVAAQLLHFDGFR
jgi:hypothetical protein